MEYCAIHSIRIPFDCYFALIRKHFNEQANHVPNFGHYINIDIPGYFNIPYRIINEIFGKHIFSDNCLDIRCEDVNIQNVIIAVNYLFQAKANEKRNKRKCIELICNDVRASSPIQVLFNHCEFVEGDSNNYEPIGKVNYNDVILLCDYFIIHDDETITVH